MIRVIRFIFISGNIADTQWILVLVSTPFVVLTLYLVNATFGALAPGVAVTLRRYRLPTELTRGGRAWLTWKANLCRGLLLLTYMKIVDALSMW